MENTFIYTCELWQIPEWTKYHQWRVWSYPHIWKYNKYLQRFYSMSVYVQTSISFHADKQINLNKHVASTSASQMATHWLIDISAHAQHAHKSQSHPNSVVPIAHAAKEMQTESAHLGAKGTDGRVHVESLLSLYRKTNHIQQNLIFLPTNNLL